MTQFRKVSAQQETWRVLGLSPEGDHPGHHALHVHLGKPRSRRNAGLFANTPAGNTCPGGIYFHKSQFLVQTGSCLPRPIKRGVSFASASAWLHLSCSLIFKSSAGFSVETSACTQQADCASSRAVLAKPPKTRLLGAFPTGQCAALTSRYCAQFLVISKHAVSVD